MNGETHRLRVQEYLALWYEGQARLAPPFPMFQERRKQLLEMAKVCRESASPAECTVAYFDMTPDSL